MKFIKKMRNLKKAKVFFAVIAIIGFFGMLGSAGAMDCGTSFLSVCTRLVFFAGAFAIGFIGMKHCENELALMRKRLINAKRQAMTDNPRTSKSPNNEAAHSTFCDIA